MCDNRERHVFESLNVSKNGSNLNCLLWCADQDATRMLTLLKQRKISCILKVKTKRVHSCSAQLSTFIKIAQRRVDKSP